MNVSDAETLEKVEKMDEHPILVSVAVYFGKTRLIDNTILNSAKKKDGGANASSSRQ